MTVHLQSRHSPRWRFFLALVLVGVAAAFAVPRAAVAADYYVCDCASGADAQCAVGNNTSAGTTPATAWRTYDRAQDAFGTLAAGDHLNFCRGGVFPVGGSTQWVNRNCTAAQNCHIGAYVAPWASGDESRPRIAQTSGAGFAFANGGDGEREHGYRVSDLDIACTACVSGDWGIFFYNDIDDVRLERLRISGFSIGVHLAGSNPCGSDPQCDRHNSRITLVDSDVVDNFDMGWLGADIDLLIADNRFLRNGSGSVFEHNLYLSQSGGATTGVRVLRNELYRSAASATGSCQGGSFAVHGEHTDLLIEGNLLHEDIGAADQSCWGIGITAAYGTPEGFVRTIVRGNTIRNMGNVAIALSSCVDCIIENNRIEHAQAFGVFGVVAPASARASDDMAMTRLTVRNNSIYTTAPNGGGIRVGTEGTQHVIVSNAMHATTASGSFHCLSLDLPFVAYSAVNNNVCGYVTGAGREWEEGSGALASWRVASGFDMASQAAAPGFAAPGVPTHDLTAASATSPMVGAGHATLSAPREFHGNLRTAPPDAGAHEYGVGESIFEDGFE